MRAQVKSHINTKRGKVCAKCRNVLYCFLTLD